jgi:hypothetical protein
MENFSRLLTLNTVAWGKPSSTASGSREPEASTRGWGAGLEKLSLGPLLRAVPFPATPGVGRYTIKGEQSNGFTFSLNIPKSFVPAAKIML